MDVNKKDYLLLLPLFLPSLTRLSLNPTVTIPRQSSTTLMTERMSRNQTKSAALGPFPDPQAMRMFLSGSVWSMK